MPAPAPPATPQGTGSAVAAALHPIPSAAKPPSCTTSSTVTMNCRDDVQDRGGDTARANRLEHDRASWTCPLLRRARARLPAQESRATTMSTSRTESTSTQTSTSGLPCRAAGAGSSVSPMLGQVLPRLMPYVSTRRGHACERNSDLSMSQPTALGSWR